VSLLLLASPLFCCSAVDTAVAGVLAVVDVPLVPVMAIVSAVAAVLNAVDDPSATSFPTSLASLNLVASLPLLSRLCCCCPIHDVVGVAAFDVPADAGSPPFRCRSCCSRSSSTKDYLTMAIVLVVFSAEGLLIICY
jgi:hypothetical protein